jgi:transposase
MQTITTIGLDIAKSVFQVHGVDASGSAASIEELDHMTFLATRRRGFGHVSHCCPCQNF